MDGKKEDSILVALLLTLTGGFLDAYTFMLRGGTFANAQTGNIVMTGVNLAKGNAGDAITNVSAIIAFVIGILCSVFCMKNFKFKRFQGKKKIRNIKKIYQTTKKKAKIQKTKSKEKQS